MSKYIKTAINLMFFWFCNVYSQNNTITTGADASNTNGSISYSIGQIDYVSSDNGSTFINQGLQQPFEIVTLSGNEILNISISAEVYPNPTANNLIISLQNYNYENLTYKLFDVRGREIINGIISNSETIVNMQPYASATYVLKISKKNKEIKSFKILKKE
jgi:hypothetical protein